jgi:hypothetical protein
MEAHIYEALYEYDEAIRIFESLMKMEKADFSVSSLEKYGNLRMKKYVMEYLAATSGGQKVSAESRKQWLQNADNVISGLESLLTISPTAERYNLLGSAYKRRAFLCNSIPEKRSSYAQAAYYYREAHKQDGKVYQSYGLSNWYALEGMLTLAGERRWKGKAQIVGKEAYSLPSKAEVVDQLNALIRSAEAQQDSTNDYWALMEGPNCQLCLQMIDSAGTKDGWSKVLNAYTNVWGKAGSRGEKAAELEHLQILIDALSLGEHRHEAIKEALGNLNEELEKLL